MAAASTAPARAAGVRRRSRRARATSRVSTGATWAATVEVRIGPLGPYAGGFGRAWPLFLTVLPLLVGPPFVVAMLRRFSRPGRAAARRILAQPSPATRRCCGSLCPGRSGATGATEQDGRPHSTLRTTEAPPAISSPLSLPGSAKPKRSSSRRSAARPVSRRARPGSPPRTARRRARFVIERRAFGEYDPETWLLDPAGTPQAMIRRTGMGEFALLRADGKALGTLSRPYGRRRLHGRGPGRDGSTRPWPPADRTWMLRVEPDTPPMLRGPDPGLPVRREAPSERDVHQAPKTRSPLAAMVSHRPARSVSFTSAMQRTVSGTRWGALRPAAVRHRREVRRVGLHQEQLRRRDGGGLAQAGRRS